MKLLITAALAAVLATPVAAQTVNRERLMQDMTALSADAMQGRSVGTEGGRVAREYIVREFEAAGLRPAADDWLLPFTAGPNRSLREPVQAYNVAGVIRGSEDPDHYIVVTAHYDHEGVQDGEIYNGADDNASGTAALIELATLLRDHPPRHSVVFVALDGEESGLLGARAFVREPVVPLADVVLNINMDMIARGDNGILWVVGTRQYPGLIPVIDALPQQAGITRQYGHDDPSDPDEWLTRSDQAAFHARGVPVIFFSVDDHPDYHRPTDDAERINADWYGGAAQTAFDLLGAVDRMERPDFRPAPRAGKAGNF